MSIIGDQQANSVENCYYCNSYNSLDQSFPLNEAKHKLNDDTPRCDLHFQYTCNACNNQKHFGGIAWCSHCKKFTCIQCSQERLNFTSFLYYDYYYQLDCKECGNEIHCLDYAEYNCDHPFQTGDLRPSGTIQIYFPTQEPTMVEEFPNKFWGSQRILNLSMASRMTPKLNDEVDSVERWNSLADIWAENFPEGGDYHHKELIIPNVLELLNLNLEDIILDVACGEGNFARIMSKKVNRVVGIDPSKMLNYALERSKDYDNIDFKKINIHNLNSILSEKFNKIVCNMALMDIDDLDLSIKNISNQLNHNGIFVFSITHPTFAWPITKTIKLPRDSPRNEDRIWVVDNYSDDKPIEVDAGFDVPFLYFPRTISTYINSLSKYGLRVEEMREPVASEELTRKFPRDAFRDHDRIPPFMMVKCRKVEIR